MGSCAVVLNFYAPWCPWCQRLEPTWEVVAKEVHKRYPEADGRIRFGKVDCTQEVAMCREHHITGFPSIRVFRKGSDDITVQGVREHESYRGEVLLTVLPPHSPAPGFNQDFITCRDVRRALVHSYEYLSAAADSGAVCCRGSH